MTHARTVWLVGMMGAGKSTVGRALADALRLPFVDTDEEVERRAGRSVAEIFAMEGEPAFRKREREVVGEQVEGAAVVALGGGAICQPEVRELVSGQPGTLVYLRAAPETLLERVGGAEARPLLSGVAPERRVERLRELLAERRADYESAELCLDTDELGFDEVVERLADALRGEA